MSSPDDKLTRGIAAAFPPGGQTVIRPSAAPVPRPLPVQIDSFEIVRELGHGGMGIVYEAEQRTPRRRVALKVARASFHPSAARRFAHEGEMLARLKHAAIAEIYAAGMCHTPELGEISFFAMALVENARSITDYADDEVLSLEQRIELFLEALGGIEHGHLRGVVHRDLKPSNLLVDGSGHVKVIDFGLARTSVHDAEHHSMHTRSGELLGTPQYMSPEQWADPKSVDARADVYSMGVVLFELLSGELPYDLSGKSTLEIGDVVRNSPPNRLALESVGPRSDLDVILRTALEKDRAHRYATTSAMIADLRGYLANEPIAARAPSTIYQLRKFARRNRGLVAAIAAVLLVSVVGFAVSLHFGLVAQQRSELLDERLYAARVARMFAAHEEGASRQVRQFLHEVAERSHQFEWRRLSALTSDRSRRVIRDDGLFTMITREPQHVQHVAVDHSGTRAAAAGADGRVRVWGLETGELIRTIEAGASPLRSVAWNADGTQIVSGATDGFVQVSDAASGSAVARFLATPWNEGSQAPCHAVGVAFGPKPDLVTVTVPRPHARARIYDLQTQVVAFESRPHTCLEGVLDVRSAADDPILLGDRLFTPGREVREARFRARANSRSVDAAFSPDGTRVLFARRNQIVEVCDVATGSSVWSVRGHDSCPASTAWSTDGAIVATGAADDAIKLWDARTGDHLDTLLGHSGFVQTLHFTSPATLVSSSMDGTIRVWDIESPLDREVELPAQELHSVEFSADGDRVLVGGALGASVIVDASTGRIGRQLGSETWSRAVRRRPGSSDIAQATDSGRVLVFGPEEAPRLTLEASAYTFSLAYSATGRLLAAGGVNGRLRIWRADDGLLLTDIEAFRGPIQGLAFAPDEMTVVCGGNDGKVVLVRTRDGAPVWRARHSGLVLSVAFHPDGERITTGDRDGVVRQWSVVDGRLLSELVGFVGSATALAYTHDGGRLFVGYSTGIVKLWSDDGDELFSVRGLDAAIRGIALSPDESRFAIAGDTPLVQIWGAWPR